MYLTSTFFPLLILLVTIFHIFIEIVLVYVYYDHKHIFDYKPNGILS